MKHERNKPCHCGSGKKYKKCHLLIEFEETRLANKRFREMLAKKQEAFKEELKTVTNNPQERMPRMNMLTATLVAAVMGSIGNPLRK